MCNLSVLMNMRDTFVRIYFHKILDTQHPVRIFCKVSKEMHVSIYVPGRLRAYLNLHVSKKIDMPDTFACI